MFGFWKRRKKTTDSPPTYDGEGIWLGCPDCGQAHEKLEDPDFDALMERLCSEVGESSRELYREFGMDSGDGRWDVLPEEGIFKITTPEGRTAHARYGLVASWNSDTHSWLWAWAFPEEWNTPEACLQPVRATRARAEQEGWEAATRRVLRINEHQAWHLTNLVAEVNGFPMTYRGKVNDDNHHYYAVDRLAWAN